MGYVRTACRAPRCNKWAYGFCVQIWIRQFADAAGWDRNTLPSMRWSGSGSKKVGSWSEMRIWIVKRGLGIGWGLVFEGPPPPHQKKIWSKWLALWDNCRSSWSFSHFNQRDWYKSFSFSLLQLELCWDISINFGKKQTRNKNRFLSLCRVF